MFCFFSKVTPFHYLIDLTFFLAKKRNLYARMNLFVHSETPQLKLKRMSAPSPSILGYPGGHLGGLEDGREGSWAAKGRAGGRISGREGKELRA